MEQLQKRYVIQNTETIDGELKACYYNSGQYGFVGNMQYATRYKEITDGAKSDLKYCQDWASGESKLIEVWHSERSYRIYLPEDVPAGYELVNLTTSLNKTNTMNYEFKGTGGNWYIVNYRDEIPEFAIESDVDDFATDGRICSHKFWGEGFRAEAFANAHLIASAPDLLKRCIDMVDALCGDQECEEELKKGLGIPVFNQMIQMKETIHAALNLPTP